MVASALYHYFSKLLLKDSLITEKKDHVHSAPEKHLKKHVLDMLQVVNKETRTLLLTFSIFHVLF